MSIVARAAEEYATSLEKTWTTDRTQTVGASEEGMCGRRVVFQKFGHAPDPDYVDTWGARMRGNLIENHLLVPALRKMYGAQAMFLGEEQQTFVDGFCSATPDCVLDAYPPIVVELKSIDPRVNLVEPKPEHVYQVQMQMGILRATTKWQPEYAVISYTDASFLNDTKEFRIEFDPDIYAAGKKRAARLMTAETPFEIEPEGWIAGGAQGECRYCPFQRSCGIKGAGQVPAEDNSKVADPQFIAQVSDLAKQLKFAEASVDMAESQRRALQYDIKELLKAKGLRRVVGDGVAVSWLPVKGRESLDTDLLKQDAAAAGIDIANYTKTGEAGERLTVTLKAKKEKSKAA